MHVKLKFHKIVFGRNSLLSCQIILKFCSEHGSITAMLWANFGNYLTTEMEVQDEQDFEIWVIKWVSDGYPITCIWQQLPFLYLLYAISLSIEMWYNEILLSLCYCITQVKLHQNMLDFWVTHWIGNHFIWFELSDCPTWQLSDTKMGIIIKQLFVLLVLLCIFIWFSRE